MVQGTCIRFACVDTSVYLCMHPHRESVTLSNEKAGRIAARFDVGANAFTLRRTLPSSVIHRDSDFIRTLRVLYQAGYTVNLGVLSYIMQQTQPCVPSPESDEALLVLLRMWLKARLAPVTPQRD